MIDREYHELIVITVLSQTCFFMQLDDFARDRYNGKHGY